MKLDIEKIKAALIDARDALGCANDSSLNLLKDAIICGFDYVEQALAALEAYDPDAIRLECAEAAVRFIEQFDETADDGAGDFWTVADIRSAILNVGKE